MCLQAGPSCELHLCSHACVPWGPGWLWAWCYHSGRRCSAQPCALFLADSDAHRERRNYQLPTSLWGTLGKRQRGEKGQSEMLIKALQLTMDKNKVWRLIYSLKLLYINPELWTWVLSYQLWRAVWSAGRSWADPAGLNDGTAAWSWERCSGSSAASPGSPAARTRCTGRTTCPEPRWRDRTGGWGSWYSELLLNTFSSRLAHIWCTSEYFLLQHVTLTWNKAVLPWSLQQSQQQCGSIMCLLEFLVNNGQTTLPNAVRAAKKR